MINPLFDQEIYKILTLFSLSPGSRLRRNDIKEKTRLNNIPLDNSMLRLISSQVILKEKNLYSLNLAKKQIKQLIKIIKKDYIYLKELPIDVYYSLIDIIDILCLEKNIKVFLFGSYAKLIYSRKSDVDIAVIHNPDLKKTGLNKKIKKIEKRYGKNIELHFFEKKGFYKNKKDPLVKGILKDGVKLI
ncbi:hypothetical protein GF336_01720 [Candidatus Woesearchaeota archaeon]|nr:hypothetical protein [Candidatus Woesearchaeota archaeon]